MISVGVIILIMWYRPLDSKFANNIETFNEVVTCWTLYLMMLFSDYVPKAEDRNTFGIAFIVVLCGYAGVHFTFLFLDMG